MPYKTLLWTDSIKAKTPTENMTMEQQTITRNQSNGLSNKQDSSITSFNQSQQTNDQVAFESARHRRRTKQIKRAKDNLLAKDPERTEHKTASLRRKFNRLVKEQARETYWTEGGVHTKYILSNDPVEDYSTDESDDVSDYTDANDDSSEDEPKGILHDIGATLAGGAIDKMDTWLKEQILMTRNGLSSAIDFNSSTITDFVQQILLTSVQWTIQPPTWGVIALEIVKQILNVIPSIGRDIRSRIHVFFTTLITRPQVQDSNAGGYQTQSGTTDNFEATTLTAVSFGLGDLLVGKTPNMRSLLRSASSLGRDLHGLKQGTTAVADMFKWIAELIQERVIHQLQTLWLKKEPSEKGIDYKDFVERVNEFCVIPARELGSPDNCTEIGELMAIYNKIESEFFECKSKLGKISVNIVKNAQKRIYEIYRTNLVIFSEVYHALRPCPFVIQLDGEAGVGKSSILPTLLQHITMDSVCGKSFDRKNLIYTRGNTRFWDGFTDQRVLIIDEPFQGRGYAPETSTALEFINLVSEIPMRLDMASLASKGVCANFELIGVTSNCAYPDFNEIYCDQAVYRRRNLLFRVHAYKKDVFPQSSKPRSAYYIMHPIEKTTVPTEFNQELALSYEEMVHVCGVEFKYWLETAEERKSKQVSLEDVLMVEQSAEVNQDRIAKITGKQIYRPKRAAPLLPTPDQNLLSRSLNVTTQTEQIDDPTEPRHVTQSLTLPTDYRHIRSMYTTNQSCCIPTLSCPRDSEELGYSMCMSSLNVMSPKGLFKMNYDYNELTDDKQDMLCDMFDNNWNLPFIKTNSQFDDWIMDGDVAKLWDVMRAERLRRPQAYRCYDWEKLPLTYIIPRDRENYAYYQSSEDREPEEITAVAMPFAPQRFDRYVIEAGVSEEPEDILTADVPIPQRFDRYITEAGVGDGCEWLLGHLKGSVKYAKELLTLLPPWALNVMIGIGFAASAFTLYHVVKTQPKINAWASCRYDEFLKSVHPKYQEDVKDLLERKEEEIKYVEEVLESDRSSQEKYDLISQAATHYNNDMARPRLPRITRPRIQTTLAKLKTEMSLDNVSSKIELIRQNLVVFSADAGGQIHFVNGTAIADRYILAPKHFFSVLKKNGIKKLTISRKSSVPVEIELANMTQLDIPQACDNVIIKMPKTFPAMRNIIKHFVLDKDLSMLRNFKGVRIYKDKNDSYGHSDVQVRMIAKQQYDNPITQETITVAQGFQYESSVPGGCGSPLLVSTNQQMGVICGMHVAGNGHNGIAEVITKEMIEAIVDNVTPAPIDETLFETQSEATTIAVGGNVDYIGKVPDKCNSYCGTDTAFIPSIIHGVFPVNHEPSVKSLRDDRIGEEAKKGDTPLIKGIMKYSVPAKPFSKAHIQRAVAIITSQIKRFQPMHGERRALTMEETINGVGIDLPRIDQSTSPGVPYLYYAMKTKQRGKQAFFVESPLSTSDKQIFELDMVREVEGLRLGEFLLANLAEKEKKLTSGIVPFYCATENLKDELLSLKKIEAAKTRTFEGMPLDILMLSRKYFGMWVMAMQQNCVELPISVGLTTPGLDWARLYRRLDRFPNILAGDYQLWDGKLMADVMFAAGDIVNNWYSDQSNDRDGNNARAALIESWVHTFVSVGKNLVQTHQGLPSGVCVTAPLNSLCNWIYCICAILEQAEIENQTVSDLDIVNNVEFAFYGDDHVCSVSDNFKSLFNFRVMKACMDRHGIGYTTSDKIERDIVDFEDLSKITYLKRKFVKLSLSDVRAPLDMESIKRQMNWTRKRQGVDDITALMEHYDSFCTELHQHGRKIYEETVETFNSAIRDFIENNPQKSVGLYEITQTFDYYEDKYLAGLGLAGATLKAAEKHDATSA